MTSDQSDPTSKRPLWQKLLLRRLKMLAIVIVVIVVVGGGVYLLAPQWLMQANTWRKAETAGLSTQTLQVGDTDWHYYEGGDGPTMVLLHGYASDRSVWLDSAKQLTRNFHVIIPDLPGWGDSTRHADDHYGIPAQASRLGDFLHKLGLTRPILVGHSMGGAIAGVYAANHPTRVGALALIDSFGLSFDKNDFARAALAGENPLLFDDRDGYHKAAQLLFDDPPDLPGRFVDVLVTRSTRNHDFRQRVFNTLRQPDQFKILDSRLDDLTMPVMGVWCRDDRVIDLSALDTLRNGLSNAAQINTSTINHCGHVPELERPEALDRVLTRFIVQQL